jgi:hypothetical protein
MNVKKPLLSVLILVFLLVALRMWGAAPPGELLSPVRTVVAGVLPSTETDTLLRVAYKDLGLGDVSQTVRRDEEGRFRAVLELCYPQCVIVSGSAEYPMFVFPGDSLFLAVGPKGQERYSGTASTASFNTLKNRYRYHEQATYWRLWNDLADQSGTLRPDSLQQLVAKHLVEAYDSIDRFCRRESAGDFVRETLRNEAEYGLKMPMLMAPLSYAYRSRGKSTWKLPAHYYAFADSLMRRLEGSLGTGFNGINAYNFLMDYVAVRMNAPRLESLRRGNRQTALLKAVLREVGQWRDPAWSTLITARLFLQVAQEGGGLTAQSLYPDFAAQIRSRYYRDRVEAFWEHKKKAYGLAPLTEAEANVWLELKAQPRFTQWVDSLLRTHTPYIYIGIWAAWSPPCLDELERLKTVSSGWKGQVKYVGLCVASERSDWEREMQRLHPVGEHYWLDEERSQWLLNTFEVNALPRYLLLDGQGRLLQSEMFRPSDPQSLIRLRKKRSNPKP